jgi:hypothetical protein
MSSVFYILIERQIYKITEIWASCFIHVDKIVPWIKIIVFKKSNYHFFLFLYFVLSFIFFLPYSSYQTISLVSSKPGLLADKLSEVQISYFYLCLCVCQYLWIIKFLEWAYRKKWGIWGGMFIDWDMPDLLAHYRIKVITMVPYANAHSKGKVHKNTKPIRSSWGLNVTSRENAVVK